jgi:hypothetical protein
LKRVESLSNHGQEISSTQGDIMTGREMDSHMECRVGCAACCIAPSISSSIPGMENGKPAGMRCIQLSDNNHCLIFGSGLRPTVCGSLRPSSGMCGGNAGEAMQLLTEWELATRPQDK